MGYDRRVEAYARSCQILSENEATALASIRGRLINSRSVTMPSTLALASGFLGGNISPLPFMSQSLLTLVFSRMALSTSKPGLLLPEVILESPGPEIPIKVANARSV